MRNKDKGFTLIEVLVVVSILGILMGLVSVLVMRSGSHRMVNDTKQLVKTYLPNLIERYKTEFRRLPPMTVKALNSANQRWKTLTLAENTVNECIEVLFVALRHPDFTAPLSEGDLPGDKPLGNSDGDIWNMVPPGCDNPDALEVHDAWGNPIVYIDKNHYDTPVNIQNRHGDAVEVRALKKADGTYYNKSSYQVISLGENGEQEVDDPIGSDDITNFTREEQE